ncbi:MAG: DUF1553 domain-containing protein, partial [Bacteroidota bacterium]
PLDKQVEIDEITAYVAKLAAKVDAHEDRIFPRKPGVKITESPKGKAFDGRFFNALAISAKNRNPYQLQQIKKEVKGSAAYRKSIDDLRAAKFEQMAVEEGALKVLIMDTKKEPRTSYILSRGSYDRQLDSVTANVPGFLPPLRDTNINNRLALARWLLADDHPLTARVTVNRYWQSFFGVGLSKTPEDFGVQGELPSHPALLDWLAADFRDNGWDLKRLFRQIVLSNTYRQSTAVTPELLEQDPENRLLARGPRHRLPAWMLRDQALAVSGLLNDSMGGPPVFPYQPEGVWEEATFGKKQYRQSEGGDLYRRTLYTFWRRISAPTFLFDNSSRQLCSVRPYATNTPLHALTTLNDVTYTEAARVLAQDLLNEPNSDQELLQQVFLKLMARVPKEEELAILYERLAQLREEFKENPERAAKVIDTGAYPLAQDLDPTDYAAYTLIIATLMNLDEALSKQ